MYAVKAEPNRLLAKTPVALNALVASPSGKHLATKGADGVLRAQRVRDDRRLGAARTRGERFELIAQRLVEIEMVPRFHRPPQKLGTRSS